MKKGAAVVESVQPGSIAEDLNIVKGDSLININSSNVTDLIDYRFLIADEYLEVRVLKQDGEEWIFEIEKDFDEDLGLAFKSDNFDGIRSCQNRCVFCFVDQMPPGVRETLYIKDDDYRLSFLHGNFITLTNLEEKDLQRIIRMRLSPLYVSVHTTNPSLRREMLGNKRAGDILQQLKTLAANGITVHTQIVLCPEVNDAEELESTVEDLADLWPAVQSIAVVPVGLTDYRQNLTPLRKVDEEQATKVINWAKKAQERFRKRFGKTLLYLSDEFYLVAGVAIPEKNFYDEYEQLENGVGLTRLLYESWQEARRQLPKGVAPDRKVLIISSLLGTKAIKPIIDEINEVQGLTVEIRTVHNRFFGSSVTVTGLLTGNDIIQSFDGEQVSADLIIIPAVMCKKGEPLFLDGLNPADLEKKFGVPVQLVDVSSDVEDLLAAVFGEEDRRENHG